MRISILGLPGSGKTTLSQLLGGMFNVMHVSSGALARASGFAQSEAERQGQLDPNEQKIRQLIKEAIGNSTHYILDGFPRTIEQIEEVDIPLDAVLYLRLQHPQLGINRLLDRGRPDDTTEIIEKRVTTYITYTFPLVDYFSRKGILLDIDASYNIGNTLGQAVTQMAYIGIFEADQYITRSLRLKDKYYPEAFPDTNDKDT